jgi:plasmid stabilization system protein ParE
MKLRYAPRAYADIAGIFEYISQHNATAATSVVRQIRTTSRLLARYPGLGRDTDIAGVRVFPTARFPYLLYHRIQADELVILHVRDGRRDAPSKREL